MNVQSLIASESGPELANVVHHGRLTGLFNVGNKVEQRLLGVERQDAQIAGITVLLDNGASWEAFSVVSSVSYI